MSPIKMPSYTLLRDGEVHVYSTLVRLGVLPADRIVPTGWDIKITVCMPSQEITIQMKPGAVVGTKLAAVSTKMLLNIDKLYNPSQDTGIISQQEAMGRFALCDR